MKKNALLGVLLLAILCSGCGFGKMVTKYPEVSITLDDEITGFLSAADIFPAKTAHKISDGKIVFLTAKSFEDSSSTSFSAKQSEN